MSAAYCRTCERAVGPRHFYASGKSRCLNRRTWTRPLLFRLAGLIERGLSDEQIAARMHRTPEAINLARKRHGIASRTASICSAREVAKRLGVRCSKTVVRWIEAGWLAGRRGQVRGPNRQWYVRAAGLFAFLEDPAHWHRWDPGQMPPGRLREWAERTRGGVRFLHQAEVARMHCVQTATVGTWIEKGYLPAVDTGSHWVVRESDALAFVPPRIGGRPRRAPPVRFAP